MGGVMGPSPVGDEMSPESSVSCGTSPEAASSPPLVGGCADCGAVDELAELVGLSFIEKRCLVSPVVSVDGGDVCEAELVGEKCGSLRAEVGGLWRDCLCLRKSDRSSCGFVSSSSEDRCGNEPVVAGAVCGVRLSRKGTSTESSINSYTFDTARSNFSGRGGSAEKSSLSKGSLTSDGMLTSRDAFGLMYASINRCHKIFMFALSLLEISACLSELLLVILL